MSIHDERDPEDRLEALRERRREIDIRSERAEGLTQELIGVFWEVLRRRGMEPAGFRVDILPAMAGGVCGVAVELSVREGPEPIKQTKINHDS